MGTDHEPIVTVDKTRSEDVSITRSGVEVRRPIARREMDTAEAKVAQSSSLRRLL